MGNNVSGSKFKSVVVIMHKPFAVFVEQICALASYSFGNKETLPCVLVVESCGMELNKAQIFNVRTHFISKCNTVSGSDSGICSVFINSSDSACCKNHIMAVDALAFFLFPCIDRKSCRGFFYSA